MLRPLCVVTLCAGALVACASQSGQDGATAAAERFLHAAATDPAAACALLTPRTRAELETSEGQPCAQALPTLDGTVGHADTWSDQARVDTDDGTLYLTEFDTDWLVSAAGCRSDGDAPALCVLGG
jgi:uncharacterized lipoprotein NlpE involved in copper resistance